MMDLLYCHLPLHLWTNNHHTHNETLTIGPAKKDAIDSLPDWCDKDKVEKAL